ncbi:MAG TPA: hypothetical protein VKU91_07135, partial [Acidimicrobiales bacterium]|nr:hypothetical protein [Acidimicrobiales bacterium]
MIRAPSRHRGGARSLGVALVIAMVAAACSGSPHRSASPAPTTAPPAAPAAIYRWQRLDQAVLAIGGGATTTISAVVAPAATGQPWVAVGTRTSQPSATASPTSAATVWTSPDAIRWTAVTLPSTAPVSQARAAARLGASVIVVGSTGTGSGRRAAIWVAQNGGPWRQLSLPDSFASLAPRLVAGTITPASAGAGTVIDDVATGALGAFATGTAGGAVVVWYSADGTRWTQLTDAERVIDDADQPHVSSLAITSAGVVACGWVVSGSHLDAGVWHSTDGVHWQRSGASSPSFSGGGDHVITGVAPLGTGYVAVGAVRPANVWMPASWISPDGNSWSMASSSFPQSPIAGSGDEGTVVTAVTAGAAGMVAVGGGIDSSGVGPTGLGPGAAYGGWRAGDAGVQRMWTSTNGLSWVEQPLPGAAATTTGWRLDLAAASGTTTVVADDTVGQPHLLADVGGAWTEVTATPGPFGAPATVATPTALTSTGNQLYLSLDVRTPGQALGHEHTTAEVLASPDGVHWRVAAQGGPLADHHMLALLPVPGGLAAAGGTPSTSGSSYAYPQATVWASPDGRSWSIAPNAIVGGAPVFGGTTDLPARAVALARLGDSVVAVGMEAGSAVAWMQTPPSTWQPARPLDSTPSLAVEVPEGACGGPQAVVAVGSAQVGAPGSQAAAWSSTDGRRWQAATVTPPAVAGEDEAMSGCLATGNAFLAYGSSAGPDGTTDPALWQSASGTAWTRQVVSAFAGYGGGGITDLALRGDTWLAVGGAVGDGASATSALDSVEVWRSEDAGRTWQAIATAAGPWAAGLESDALLVGFSGTTPVVVGQVDGGLAVWTGTPLP